MNSFKFAKIIFCSLITCLLFSSCFKDVDLEQAQDIVLEPDLEVDLLHYQLSGLDFVHSSTNEFSPIIRDTVRLEFLDDDYIQDGLVYAGLRFRHENSFPYDIESNIKFLNERNRNQFNIAYIIPKGSAASPSIVDTLHVLEGSEIVKIRRSIKMVVRLKIIEADKDLEGGLKFMSKGLFRFEF